MIDATAETLDVLIEETHSPLILDFWAPWCGPCKALTPVLDELEPSFTGRAHFLKINIDEDQTLAKRYHIRSVPTLVILKKGTVAAQKSGALPKEVLRTWINENIM